MKQIVFSLPGNEFLAPKILTGLNAELAEYELRTFPDGETYLRIMSDVEDKDVFIICTLYQPDHKILPLFFLCNLLKDLKAKSICLVSPYLAYMRQDKHFYPGDAVTSVYFASLISRFCDHLITVDPHLHRRASLNEIYYIPCEVLHAGDSIAGWIKVNIPHALLIGPDSESFQWVSQIAKNADVPFLILEKKRLGDHHVEITVPDIQTYKEYTPVLIDDIISTGGTMIKTLNHLKAAGMRSPVCIGVHAIFAGNAYNDLKMAGVERIVTCNTIAHETNTIDISKILIDSLINKSV